jgi:hypothetical protein
MRKCTSHRVVSATRTRYDALAARSRAARTRTAVAIGALRAAHRFARGGGADALRDLGRQHQRRHVGILHQLLLERLRGTLLGQLPTRRTPPGPCQVRSRPECSHERTRRVAPSSSPHHAACPPLALLPNKSTPTPLRLRAQTCAHGVHIVRAPSPIRPTAGESLWREAAAGRLRQAGCGRQAAERRCGGGAVGDLCRTQRTSLAASPSEPMAGSLA